MPTVESIVRQSAIHLERERIGIRKTPELATGLFNLTSFALQLDVRDFLVFINTSALVRACGRAHRAAQNVFLFREMHRVRKLNIGSANALFCAGTHLTKYTDMNRLSCSTDGVSGNLTVADWLTRDLCVFLLIYMAFFQS